MSEAVPIARDVLCDPARVLAIERSGLTAESDDRMEFFARWVRRALDVPVALVSLVQPDQQVFPGMSGLPEPWASRRSTPLSHSFCQHVVVSGEPLVVEDAREHPLVRDNVAIPDIGVIAYAGMPLTDETGSVLGSLCAIDSAPRPWPAAHIEELRHLAEACSAELRLRLARFDAGQERERRDGLEHQLRRAFRRSDVLLRTSQAFTQTETVADVRATLTDLMASELAPAYVGLSLLDGGRMERLPDARFPDGAEYGGAWTGYGVGSPLPTATAVRKGTVVSYPDRATFDAAHPVEAQDMLRHLGLHACAAIPLSGLDGPLGAVLFGWAAPRLLSPEDEVTISTIGGFAAQAITRARHLAHRTSVAHQLQEAMLTTLPEIAGLELAARYQPADAREHVGGDWFDAAVVPDGSEEVVVVSVGDIIGHELKAATVMGQVRSMLRQSSWDHPAGPPSRVVTAFEDANSGLGIGGAGTAVLAHLRRTGVGWRMQWTNAGHPPPVLVAPDGTVELLDAHDVLFGFSVSRLRPRCDHERAVEPGSLLFLYTDGLVERRGHDLDEGVADLVAVLAELRARPADEIVEKTVARLAPDAGDDVVAFAIRFV